MKFTPLLIDFAVLGLVCAGGVLRQRSLAAARLVAWVAMLASLGSPLLAAAIHAPQWITSVSVVMMVVGFSGLAAAASARGPAPDAENHAPEPRRTVSTFTRRGLPVGPLSDEMWAQFERDFARYVASQTRARSAAGARRRRARHRR